LDENWSDDEEADFESPLDDVDPFVFFANCMKCKDILLAVLSLKLSLIKTRITLNESEDLFRPDNHNAYKPRWNGLCIERIWLRLNIHKEDHIVSFHQRLLKLFLTFL